MRLNWPFWAAILTGLCAQAHAASATDIWKRVLSKCAKSNEIGKHVLFFGVSNTVGPGSVWRFDEDDKTIRLQYELSDAIASEQDRAKIVKVNSLGDCSGTADRSWDIKLGLPFSTGTTSVSLDIEAELKHANKITVGVTKMAVDNLKEVEWTTAMRKLPQDDPHRADLKKPGRVVASNVVKISGMKTTLTFSTALTADLKAKYQGTTFKLGDNGATLHAEIKGDNTIELTTDGTVYLLAAYSKLVGGALGLDGGGAGAPMQDLALPADTKIGKPERSSSSH